MLIENPFCLQLNLSPLLAILLASPLFPPSDSVPLCSPHRSQSVFGRPPLLAQQSNDPTAQNNLVGSTAPQIEKEQLNLAVNEAIFFLRGIIYPVFGVFL